MTTDPLTTAALLGTARLTTLPPSPDLVLEPVWEAIDLANPADAVLRALALTRALQRAGVRTTEAAAADAAAVETRPELPAAAVDAGLRMMGGECVEALPEWLALANQRGLVLPGRALPEALAMATGQRKFRGAMRSLAGERGLWIARRRAEFSWVLEEAAVSDEAWDGNRPTERLAWLRQTRTTDPARAAAAIMAQWSGEDGSFREAVVKLVSEAPHDVDESWLESLALKDRRQETREAAVTALIRLPGSAFRRRAIERAKRLVKVERKLLRRFLVVEPPSAFDPAWAADGVKDKPPQGTGEKAWWARQLIGLVPVAEWPGLLALSEDALFDLAVEKDWHEALLLGWLDAAMRWPDQALATRLIPYLTKLESWQAGPPRLIVIGQLLGALAIGPRYRALDQLAAALPTAEWIELLARCGEPPPPGEGRASLAALDQALATIPTPFQKPQARALAVCVPADGIAARLEVISKLSDLSPAAGEFAHMLEFRRSIHAPFTASAP